MPLLSGLVILLGLSAASIAVGRLTTGKRLPDSATPFEHLLLCGAAGLGMLQWIPFLLFSLGAGSPNVLRLVSAVVLAASLAALRKSAVRGEMRFLSDWKTWDWQSLLPPLLLMLLLSLQMLRAVCPPSDDDGVSYHLTTLLRTMQAGRFHLLPTLTYSNWPMCGEMLFAYPAAFAQHRPVALVQLLAGGLCILLTICIAKRIGGDRAAAWACAGLLVYKPLWVEMGQAHIDLLTAAFTLAAVLCLLLRCRDEPESGVLPTAVFCGLAATTKLNGIAVSATMAVLLLLHHGRRGLRCAALVPAISLAMLLPWLLKSMWITGNPVYPFAWGVLGGAEWTSEGLARMQRYFLLLFTVPGLPRDNTTLLLVRLGTAALAVSAFAAVRRRSPDHLPLQAGLLSAAAVFAVSGYNLRFVIASVCLVLMSLCVLLHRMLPRWRWAPTCLCLLLLFSGYRGLTDGGVPSALRFVSGSWTGEEYLSDRIPGHDITLIANRTLPKDAGILVATWQEATAWFRARAFRANYWLQDSVHYDSTRRAAEDMKRLRIQYLVLAQNEPWCRTSLVCDGRDRTETTTLTYISKRFGTLLAEKQGVSLYQLDVDRALMETRPIAMGDTDTPAVQHSAGSPFATVCYAAGRAPRTW